MRLRAKYLIPDSQTVIENGAVVIQDDRIAWVGRYPNTPAYDQPTRDLGEAVILPGFVNAHTHLELTHHRDLVERTPRFTDWILQLLQNRKDDKSWVDRAIQDGVQMSLAGGATTVGDIHGFGRSAQTLKALPIRKVLFFEVTGFSPERTQLGIERLQNHLRVAPSPDALFTISVSPHAPYSTSAALYRHCCGFRIADCFSFRNPKSEIRNRVPPLCTHLAETPDELEFLAHGTGAFADLLDTLQIPRQDWTPPGRTPVAYMQDLGVLAHRPLLAHCNYLTDADIQTLARSGATVVFCPRSHHYFYHTDHPIKRLLDAGVNVAIGTDSHASNWSLSMLDELRFLFNAYHTSLAPETLLALVTLNGAKGLGLKRVGKLRAGWQADLIAIRIPDDGRDWFERICDEASENVLTVVAGKICYDAAT